MLLFIATIFATTSILPFASPASAINPADVVAIWQQTIGGEAGPRVERYSAAGSLLETFFASRPVAGMYAAGLGVAASGDILIIWHQTIGGESGPRVHRYTS